MRFSAATSALLATLPLAFAQNTTFLDGLNDALNSNGLTSLANISSVLRNTTAGPSVLTQLSSGSPYVLFAPTNDARKSTPLTRPADGSFAFLSERSSEQLYG